MISQEFTDEQRAILDKVQKLLNLAGKNPNEAEAESATAKAMALLAAHQLDVMAVERAGGDSGKRAEEKLLGGFYQFERDLWHRIADLNFCMYWTQKVRVHTTKRDQAAEDVLKAEREKLREQLKGLLMASPQERVAALNSLDHVDGQLYRLGRKKSLRPHHRLVGRTVNIAATKAMAVYIMGAMERLLRERLDARVDPHSGVSHAQQVNRMYLSQWAVSYREGIAQNLAEKLYDRREQQYREEARKAEDAKRAAATAGMASASDGTALTLASARKTEEEANMDFLYGEGYSAKQAARRAEYAKARREADEEYTKWAAANPEEAAAERAKAEKESVRRSSRAYKAPKEKDRDWSAYKAGYAAGDKIGLDVQAEGTKVAGVL